ncbi:MAG TPA: hypothetical protein VJI74_02745 [Candidatus Paceibacterota bacterium]
MNYRLFIGLISLLSFLGIVFGLTVICGPDENNVCRGVLNDYAVPVSGLSFAVFIASFYLLFLGKQTQKAWVKFMVWFLPLSIFLIYQAPIHTRDYITPFTKEISTWWLGGIFVLVSVGIMLISSYRERKKRRESLQSPPT